jgi:hypothetical protein
MQETKIRKTNPGAPSAQQPEEEEEPMDTSSAGDAQQASDLSDAPLHKAIAHCIGKIASEETQVRSFFF